MISLILAVLHSALSGATTAEAASPPPVIPMVDTSSVLDLGQSPEEQMVSEGLPPTPESGSENPQDLLKSAPVIHSAKKPAKSASAKGAASDGLPSSLPLMPGTKPSVKESLAPPAQTLPAEEPMTSAPSASELTPEANTEIPTEEPLAEEPLPEAPTAEIPPPDNLENVVVPADPDAVASESESGTSTRKWDRSIPLYDRENPNWGVDIHASMQALGTSIQSEQLDVLGNPTGVTEESDVRNFGIGFEYEPSFLQGIGVVSLGPSFNSYVLEPAGDLTKDAFSIYSLGFSAKYQLKFMRSQPIVPFVGFETQMIRYSFERADIGTGWTTGSGVTFGALILLNWMEPSAAHTLWAETGIKRSYLVAEFKDLQAGEDVLSSDGQAIYFGMRLEY